jgi:hypothetical protein
LFRLDPIFKIIRLAGLVALASVAVVIFFGQRGGVQTAAEGVSVSRKASTPPFHLISNAFMALNPYGFRLLDLETGRLGTFSLPFENGIDLASASPWVDRGRRHVVGLGWKQAGYYGSEERGDVGILRMSVPDGEILNWIPVPSAGSLPANHFCWVPGATAAVVYAASDGKIYRIDFERSRADGRVEAVPEPSPCQVTWQTKLTGVTDVVVEDIAYPDDARLGGKILVSLRSKHSGTRRYGHSEIWWLQPDQEGTSIVEAGRLLEPAAEAEPCEQRLPGLAGDAHSPTCLLYFEHIVGRADYQLRVAPLRLDGGRRGIPQVRQAESRVAATGCLPISATSPSGRWLYVVRRSGNVLETERLVL